MRRILCAVLLLGLLALPALPAEAAEPGKYAALTFEDGPFGAPTEELLEGLAYRGARATFLLCGCRMEQYPELPARIYEEGHEIGFHGFTHDSMQSMSRQNIGRELIDSRALLPPGCEPVWFRPPGGVVTAGVRQVAKVRQLSLLSWTVDVSDWNRGSQDALEEAAAAVRDGDILLLRDSSPGAVEEALRIADLLQSRGFRLVTVSELARLRRISPKPGAVYASFPPESKGVQ